MTRPTLSVSGPASEVVASNGSVVLQVPIALKRRSGRRVVLPAGHMAGAIGRAAAAGGVERGLGERDAAITQPWCSSGTSIVSRVDSWPPCMVCVDVNTAAGLPARLPCSHSVDVWSMKCLSGAAMFPKRVGLPRMSPSAALRSSRVA